MRTGCIEPCGSRTTIRQGVRPHARKFSMWAAIVVAALLWQAEQHRTHGWVLPALGTPSHLWAQRGGPEDTTVPGCAKLARREAALMLIGFSGLAAPSTPLPASAIDGSGPIVILGAGGRTGRLCAEILRTASRSVKAFGRADVDVVKASVEDIAAAVQGADAVIFAASASAKGGDSKEVDEQGAIKAAKACVLAGIPKYVLISSGGVARPGSLGYVATNWMPGPTWGVMDAKARGEEGAKAAVRGTQTKYAIVRPGGLEDSAALGPGAMEINQGDAVGGLVSRADVAAAAVAAASSPDTDDTTFELYAYGAAFSQQPGPTDLWLPSGPTGYERRGKSWPELFRGLRKDFSKV
mmetsp:Transcript_100312/g.259418  ORF Transcript_100312/g.259418 Transcript_100312/m.259418 type:complete len:353 (+) Transcript_100312:45-1103(+)